MGSGMIPVKADERVEIALEKLIPRALEVGLDIQDLIIDPLALTVSGCQEYCPECVEAVRTLKFAWDPAAVGQCRPVQCLKLRAPRHALSDKPGVPGLCFAKSWIPPAIPVSAAENWTGKASLRIFSAI